MHFFATVFSCIGVAVYVCLALAPLIFLGLVFRTILRENKVKK